MCVTIEPLDFLGAPATRKHFLKSLKPLFCAFSMMQLGLFSTTSQRLHATCQKGRIAPFETSSSGRLSHIFNKVGSEGKGGEYGDEFFEEDEETFCPTFSDIRRVVMTCILATDMELFRHHHEAMRKRTQMKRSEL